MAHDLTCFRLSDMTRCGIALRGVAEGAECMEQVADGIVRYLYDNLVDRSGERCCALVRFYNTHPYGDLDADQQLFARSVLGGQPVPAAVRCLTLLATAGEEPQWNSRRRSVSHKAMPLPSAETIERAPMIASLVAQFGLEVGTLIEPDPRLVIDAEQRTYNVFYVPEAQGSPYIPAQQEFVMPYRVSSVLGFGGLLPSGDLFAVIIFSKAPIVRETADLFKTLALNVKLAILPFVGGRIFA